MKTFHNKMLVQRLGLMLLANLVTQPKDALRQLLGDDAEEEDDGWFFEGEAVAKARRERGGLGAAIETLNREGRLRRRGPQDMSTPGKIIAAFHIGDPADVADSWRIFRRRERLYEAARRLAQAIADGRPYAAPQISSKSITSGR